MSLILILLSISYMIIFNNQEYYPILVKVVIIVVTIIGSLSALSYRASASNTLPPGQSQSATGGPWIGQICYRPDSQTHHHSIAGLQVGGLLQAAYQDRATGRLPVIASGPGRGVQFEALILPQWR
jgi:hypothetical protein